MAVIIAAAALAACSLANVRLPALFSDNMVLQRNMKVPVWGWADPGETVVVEMLGMKAQTTAGRDGKWMVRIGPFSAGGPYEMRVRGKNTIVLKNVLVGEVWVASGQSNMEWPVRAVVNAQEEIKWARYDRIRLFKVPRRPSLKPEEDVNATWQVCSPETVGNFSAVAYFFGREVHVRTGLPVGLIQTCWGGTPVEAWMPPETLQAQGPEFEAVRKRLESMLEKWPDAREHYADKYYPQWQRAWGQWWRARRQWQKAVAEAKKAGKPAPKPPAPPPPVGSPHTPTALYLGMVKPLIPYAIRGAIWYQGESNAGRAYAYRKLFPAMIEGWRKAWGQGDFPFYFVQLANFMAWQKQPAEDSAWAELREAQFMALRLPNTGMAVIIDIGEANDIHPKNKQEVGRRLALWALAKVYGQNVVYSGPLYKGYRVEGNKVRIFFDHVDGGLTFLGQQLLGFAIAGEDRKFHWAKAKIEGDSVVVWSDEVPRPVAVRYGWANNPICNLYNKAILPASPFRTDDWPGVTAGKY